MQDHLNPKYIDHNFSKWGRSRFLPHLPSIPVRIRKWRTIPAPPIYLEK
jgi:hypothetical protein